MQRQPKTSALTTHNQVQASPVLVTALDIHSGQHHENKDINGWTCRRKKFYPHHIYCRSVKGKERHLGENEIDSFITQSDVFLDLKMILLLHVNLPRKFSIIDTYFK